MGQPAGMAHFVRSNKCLVGRFCFDPAPNTPLWSAARPVLPAGLVKLFRRQPRLAVEDQPPIGKQRACSVRRLDMHDRSRVGKKSYILRLTSFSNCSEIVVRSKTKPD